MWLNLGETDSLEDSSQVPSLNLALRGGIINFHSLQERFTRVHETLSNLGEDLIFNKVLQAAATMSDIGVHFSNEVIIGDLTIRGRRNQPHQIVDLIVLYSDFQCSESLSQLLLRYDAITVDIKELKCLFEIEVLYVKRCGNLI